MKTLKLILYFIWELPQNIIGAILLLIVKIFKLYYKETEVSPWIIFDKDRFFICCKDFGVSLGFFIFWRDSTDCRDHEYGHSLQSMMFGILYLPVIGLVSFIRATYVWFSLTFISSKLTYAEQYHLGRKLTKWYYSGFPEDWADKLGEVERG